MERTGKVRRILWIWIVMVAVAGIVLGSSMAMAGTFDAWNYRMKITFSGYPPAGGETLTNFPTLVVLSTNIVGFSYTDFYSASGADLRFAVSNEVTELNYEIEKWDTNGSSYVWVQVPGLGSSNDFIYAYFGKNTNAPAYTTNGATWSEGYAGVWHLAETNLTDETTGGTNRDSTANTNNGIQYYSGPATGRIAGAQTFDGSADYIDCGSGASLDHASPGKRTVSAWIRPAALVNYAGVVSKDSARNSPYSYMMCCHNDGTLIAFDNTAWRASAAAGISAGNWYHVAYVTPGDTNVYFYVNGQAKGSATFVHTDDPDDNVYIGSWLPGYDFNGVIDEARIESVARSTNWVWACWLNQASNDVFISYDTVDQNATNLAVATRPASNIGVTNAALNGKVLHTGDAENPQLYFCWDYTDKGTTSTGVWGNVGYMGTNWGKGELFATNVTGLSSGSNYTYRCYVTNSTGENWSDDGQSFTTIHLPSVTNTGATNVFRQVATLRGEITDTGGNTPYAWFYYWIDGGSTTTVAKGLQSGAFSEQVSELTMATNYTYKILASNMAGTVWSVEKSFQTLSFGTGTNIWTGAASSNWSEHANWSAGDVPLAGEHVIITNKNVLLTNSTPALASFIITNATLTFTNWTTALNASNVTIQSGGIFTLPGAFATNQMSNCVHVVCTNFTLEAGGMINVGERGYTTKSGPGSGTGSTDQGGGGGYGGRGGDGSGGYGGSTYGSADAPVSPGSGGGGYSEGGKGGGAVRLEASGTVTIYGSIIANGGNGGYWGGGGSGGAIYIACGTFGGSTNGILSANGGNPASSGGGGGGGRIAVIYQNLGAEHAVRCFAAAGSGYYSTPGDDRGAHVGTLYFPDTNIFLSETLRDISGELVVPGFTSWSPSALVVSNGTVSFGDKFPLNIAGDLLVAGTNGGLVCGTNSQLTCGGNITLNNGNLVMKRDSQLTCGGNMTLNNGNLAMWQRVATTCAGNMTLNNGNLNIMEHVTISCGGYLAMTNAGKLYVYSGATNVIGPDYGALVAVTGDVVMAASSWIYPYSCASDGGSAFFRMNNLVVLTNAGFNANEKGYPVQTGPGKGGGYTDDGGGGGYGGKGGRGIIQSGGVTYGSTNAPIHPGSGGGGFGSYPGKGGGAVRIKASGSVTLNGSIIANGGQGTSSPYGGGGSGGGIYITCGTFGGSSTNGILSANGGNALGNNGGGGGGRIAVWYAVPENRIAGILDGTDMKRVSIITNAAEYSQFAGTVSVTYGIGYSNGMPGTIVFLTVTPPSGTVFMCQ